MNALEYALTLLSRSDKTERKLYEALLKKGFSEEESADAVERVKDYGYAGDEAFSRRYVEFSGTEENTFPPGAVMSGLRVRSETGPHEE